MSKPRTQFINEYAKAAYQLEAVRTSMIDICDESLEFAAEALETITHAYAIRAMRRSSGSMRGRLAAISMEAIQRVDGRSDQILELIN